MFELPEGRRLVLGAQGDADYSAFGALHAVTGFFPDHARLAARRTEVGTELDGSYGAALVHVEKSKPRTLQRLVQAHEALEVGGLLLVDGQKTEGVESILKAVRRVLDVDDVLSKAHGKLFWLRKGAASDALADWHMSALVVDGGYTTLPGVFSSDGPDQGSELLIALVPELKGRVADFGSGWGYMAGEILKEQDGIASMDMIEADLAAHSCAVQNVTDPRATQIWGDVTTHSADAYDAIICNPPFHTGRDADPDLGRAFIAAAARNLATKGKFYMVANRHLPYEAALKSYFGTGRMLAEMQGYKLYEAAKPKRR